MNEEQIEKQLEWLEKEHREDKKTIASLQKKISELEASIKGVQNNVQSLDDELVKNGVRLTKMDSYEGALEAHRKEVKKELDSHEKKAKKRENYAKEKYEKMFAELSVELADTRVGLEKFKPLSEAIEGLKKQGLARERMIHALEEHVKGFDGIEDRFKEGIKIVADDLEASKKRTTDTQGEVTALRRRLEESRAQIDLAAEAQKKIDTRILELMASEDERRENQRDFLDEISRNKLDVEKAFAEWTKRFSGIEERAETLTSALQTYNEIEISLRKAQKDFEDIVEQISRRIHEITEMQRLGEERFRQEWTTFKADDQKRWVNYSLTQEEQTKESARRHDRLNDRLTTIEEIFQDLQDSVEQNSEQMETMMQGLMGVLREWLSTNERFTDAG